MSKRIIYNQDNGNVAVIIPCNCGLTVEEIAQKDVPTGKPYAIIEASELPDREHRNAWEIDEKDLKDGWVND